MGEKKNIERVCYAESPNKTNRNVCTIQDQLVYGRVLPKKIACAMFFFQTKYVVNIQYIYGKW